MENATAHVINTLTAAHVTLYATGVSDLGWTARVYGDYGEGVVVSINILLRKSYRHVVNVLSDAGYSVIEQPGSYDVVVRRD